MIRIVKSTARPLRNFKSFSTSSTQQQANLQHYANLAFKPKVSNNTPKIPQNIEMEIKTPPWRQLAVYGLTCAVPMIGFGFMDNSIMIQVGELIDMTIGVRFGLSTLTAAACGQVFSDTSGVLFGGVVEALATKLGLPTVKFTSAQYALPMVRFTRVWFSVFGVVLGCCLGMTQLLFMDLGKAERLKAQRQMSTFFRTLVNEGHSLLECERCTLYLVEDNNILWSAGEPDEFKKPTQIELERAFSHADVNQDGVVSIEELTILMKKSFGVKVFNIHSDDQFIEILNRLGIEFTSIDKLELEFGDFCKVMPLLMEKSYGECRVPLSDYPLYTEVIETGQVLKIDNVENFVSPRHNSYDKTEFDRYRGYRTKSLLLVPVLDAETKKAFGFIEAVNKHLPSSSTAQRDVSAVSGHQHDRAGKFVRLKTQGRKWLDDRFTGFTNEDVKIVKALCSHASTFAKQCGFESA